MLSVPRLRVLKEVAYRGSVSGAAEALSYTQSAVSQQIAALEAEAGIALLERHPRGVTLTAAGQTLVAHAEGVLAGLDAAEGALAAIAGLRGGSLRVASFPTAGATLMPVAVATFSESYPDVELSLVEGEPEQIAPLLRAGDIDLALLFEFEQQKLQLAGATRVALFSDPMHLALPREHPLAESKRLRLEQLSEDAWVQTSRDSACARHVLRSCRARGFEPRVSFESDDYQTVQGLVAAGVGRGAHPRARPVGRARGHRDPLTLPGATCARGARRRSQGRPPRARSARDARHPRTGIAALGGRAPPGRSAQPATGFRELTPPAIRRLGGARNQKHDTPTTTGAGEQ